MTSKTTETFEERAARVAAEAQEIQEEQARRAQADYERLLAHQAEVDAEAIAAYDRPALEAEVTKAEAALNKAIADSPLTKALTRYYVACARRRETFEQYLGARGRQGHDISGATYPETPLLDVLDLMVRMAQSAASDVRVQLNADFHARRDNSERGNDR